MTTTRTSVISCIFDSVPVSFQTSAVEAMIMATKIAVITMKPE